MPPELSSSDSSFYRRPLPDDLIAFASPAGRQLFRGALEAGGMEGWFALAEQFHTQADPAFCGLGTLVVALNALEIDPGRIWKGPWRWYGEALLDCCMPLEEVQQKGMTLDELACLARCNGASARVRRAGEASAEALREAVRAAAQASRGPVVVAGYARARLGQTGAGHFSPVAGYHAGRDLVLILDVARFKYPPHWVPLERLWHAMSDIDPATGRARGWIVLDRGRPRSLPLFFRLSASEGVAALVAALLSEAPGLLATCPAETPEALVAGWVEAIDGRLADQLCRGLSGPPASPADLPPEHGAAVEVLLRELRATRVHGAIARSRTGDQPRPVSDEVLATLFLALPEVALEALPEPARRASAALRDPAHLGPNIAAEVAALREQLTMLRQWQSQS
jgi:glutathione gamma-glutamylcysteinyltransferase